jgi:flagellar P-ring protein precursor FlgI
MLRAVLLGFAAVLALPVQAQSIRIKDLVEFDGVRGTDLVGYGLVVGLNGTGDGLRNSPFTAEIMSNLLERLGVNVSGEQFQPKNVAAVFVTGTLPPFSRAGGRIDVTVSAIGDAKSLLGGTLVMTPMNGADGQIYAVAQGTIIAGGVSAEGQGSKVTQGVPTAGTIPAGAHVEREVQFDFSQMHSVRLALRSPDFTTAGRIEAVINQAFGGNVAVMQDAGTVSLNIDATHSNSPAHVIAKLENLTVEPQTRARVVVDQRSGTIVMDDDVRISHVAIAQGNLTLRVDEMPQVSQPDPFSQGQTIVVPRTNAEIQNAPGTGLAEVPGGANLSQVVAGLNALGVAPHDMIDILKSINAAGALHAEFLRTKAPETSVQPLATTKNASLKGKDTTAGGTIIMPIDIRIAAVTRSMIRKGKYIRNPIWNEREISDSMKEGTSRDSGASAIFAVSPGRRASNALNVSGFVRPAMKPLNGWMMRGMAC